MNRTRSRRTRPISADRSGGSTSHGEEDRAIRAPPGNHLADDAAGHHRLSALPLPHSRWTLPLRAQLLPVCPGGHRETWTDSRRVACRQTVDQMSSRGWRGIRSGSGSKARFPVTRRSPRASHQDSRAFRGASALREDDGTPSSTGSDSRRPPLRRPIMNQGAQRIPRGR